MQAGLIARDQGVEDLVVTDVAPFTLGIAISKEFGMQRRDGYFLPIIHRNTTIPVSRVERVFTTEPNQTEVVVRVYQGESRRVEHNLLLGEFVLQGVPRGPAGQPIDVRFTYDLNGILEVEATVVATRKKVTHVITRHARGLTQKQIDQAIRNMAKLKVNPREDANNRFLLRRAERAFQELSVEGRVILEQMLDGFETALELNDQEAVERHRQALVEFLDRHDGSVDNDEEVLD
ncbi:MAG: hypothetical protein KatS3mg105_0898 [Gemmatales bacterium]|nr:MAG: hypothetical protein KatS3mg105_0898 [Gemmatales bacterium]